ncbi:MAG: tetratricopeptide repeat protein [Planctomycetota bacterium]|jgi:TolA-binding protein
MRNNTVLSLFITLALFTISSYPQAADNPAKTAFSKEKLQFDFANGLFSRKLYIEAITEYKKFLQSFKKSKKLALAEYRIADSYFALGDFRSSEKSFDNFLNKYPDHNLQKKALLKLSCSKFERRNVKAAIESFKKLLSLQPDKDIYYAATYYLGRAYIDSSQPEKAAVNLEKTAEVKNQFYNLSLYELSKIYSSAKQNAKAEKLLRVFLKTNTSNELTTSAKIRLAESLREQEKLPEAEQMYIELSQKSSTYNKAQALLGLGWIRIKQNKLDEAIEVAQSGLNLQVKSLEDAFLYMHGSILLKKKDFNQAVTTLHKVKTGRYSASAAREIVWTYLGAGNLDKALSSAKFYRKTFPLHEPGTSEFLIATTLFRKADYPGAAQYFSLSRDIKKSPYREESAFQLSLALERKGDYNGSAEAYAFFFKNFQESSLLPSALLGWGNSLVKLKDFNLSIKAYGQLLNLKTALPAQKEYALSQQAVCYYELKKYSEMEKCYRKILSDFPRSTTSAEALYWVAWSEQSNKNYHKASALYKKFLNKYPKNTFAGKARYRLGMSEYQSGNESAAAETFYNIVLKYPQIRIGQNELLWLGSFFMQKSALKEAGEIYEALLKNHPEGEVRSITLYYLAEIQRKRAEYSKAIDNYKRLVSEKDQRFKSLAYFGMGKCLRLTGKIKQAEKSFKNVMFSIEDPMMASLHLELGLLAKENGRYEDAVGNFMKAGLLYDEINISGESLWLAGQLFESQGQHQKALTCYNELFKKQKGSYGERYADKSKWSRLAEKRLLNLKSP